MKSKTILTITFLLCATMTMAQQLAFPGAEGFAAFLTDMPISVRPYYAKTDNDKLAFFIDANATSNKCLNVGTASADGTTTFRKHFRK